MAQANPGYQSACLSLQELFLYFKEIVTRSSSHFFQLNAMRVRPDQNFICLLKHGFEQQSVKTCPLCFCMDYRSRLEKEVTGVRVCGMCIQSCTVGQGSAQGNRMTKTGIGDCLTTHLAVLPIRTSAMTPWP